MNCHNVLFWITIIVVFDEKLSLSSSPQQQQLVQQHSGAIALNSREQSSGPLTPALYSRGQSPEPYQQHFSPRRRQRSNGSFVSAKGSPFYDGKTESSLYFEYGCVEDESFQVLPGLGIVGEQGMNVQSGLTVEKNYCKNFKMQEFVLLRDFCQEIGFSGGLAEFYNLVQYKKREELCKSRKIVVSSSSDRDQSYWEKTLIANSLTRASVVVCEKPHPIDPNATIGIHGACCYIYPAFQQLSPQEQQCRFFEFMQQVKRDDGYKLLAINDLLNQKKSCSEKSKDCADIFRAFTVRRAQIVTILALKRSNADISWQEARECFDRTLTSDVPVNYIQELAKYLEVEDSKKH